MSRPRVFESVAEWRSFRASEELRGRTLGFIPTMGALHDGHASLIGRSTRENDLTAVSIFVNPTQFDDSEDLAKYPRTFEADRRVLEDSGADFLIYPSYDELYRDDYRYKVSESRESRILCGAHRPGHFDGVLTVVLKLLNLVRADRAYFGEKDFQQLELIRGMALAFFVPTEIVGCELVREPDGLAMSSRNARLTPAERTRAARFARILRDAPDPERARLELQEAGFEVEYVQEWKGRRLGAVHLGKVRLIDNVRI